MAGKLEERIQELKRLGAGAGTEEILRKALRDRSNLIVAEAARTAATQKLTGLIPDLLDAFDRLFKDPVKSDSKCWGKTAIIKALTDMDHSAAAPFLRAAGHVQMEPVWGGQEDSAISLRASGVLALVQCDDLSRAETIRRLVDALADPSDRVRVEVVRAIEQMNGEEAVVLLRLKAHSGDTQPAVIGQVFDSLLQLEGEHAVDFVARFMKGPESDVQGEAALALGASRLPKAVDRLIADWKSSHNHQFAATLLRALGSSREEAALTFLLHLVERGGRRDSRAALEALAIHKDSHEIQERVERACRARAAERDE
ncbi:MAG TPA: HEAT repeat domain-containing protein [Terriglobia bacterium]|nr:HEAT repeat domain-containing protein [Terriglobia bacterium]